MCRSTTTTNNAELPSYPEDRDRDRLKIRAFCLRLWVVEDFHGGGGGRRAVPEKLTLAYLPRIDGGGAVEVNGSKVRDGAPAVVALRRVRRPGERGLLFGSTDRVRLGDGARFEAYAGEEKVVSGVFRRAGGGGGPGWRMECRGCEAAEVWVVGESGAVLRERVEEKGRRRRRTTTLGLGLRSKLEEIPEESDGWDWREDEEEGVEGGDWGMEMEMEGVRWAVDVGIWVVCLGVGLLVSRASARSFRRKRLF